MKTLHLFVSGVLTVLAEISVWSASTAQGEIVFLKRVEENYAVFRISPHGGEPVLVHRCSDATNSNCQFPRWAASDGHVEFFAYTNGKWMKSSMDRNGKNIKILRPAEISELVTENSRAPDLKLEHESIIELKNGKKTMLYHGTPGESIDEISRGPDGAVVFVSDGRIKILQAGSHKAVTLTEGYYPNWK